MQSEYYTDPEDEQGTSREIDVRASWSKVNSPDTGPVTIARVTLAVECKRSIDKPWVAFTSTSGGLAGPARVIQRASDSRGQRFLRSVMSVREIQDLPLLGLPERVAHGVTQAFTSGNDVAYQAIMSAAKAAKTMSSPKGRGSARFMEIVFPVVVVEGRLFECFLSDANEIEVRACDRAVLVWRREVVDIHTIVHVVTSDAFEAFSREAAASADVLLSTAFEKKFWTLS